MSVNRPFKVLMTADAMGGVWTYALDLIRSLAPFSVEVGLATMGAPLSVQQHAEIRELANVTLFESTYKLEWMENPWEDLEAAGKWLLHLNQIFNPDLIHLNNFAQGNLNWGKPVVMVVHSCVLTWWQAVKGEPAPESWNTYRTVVRAGLQAANIVIAPSKAMLLEAESEYGGFHFSQVIYNGRDPELFNFTPKENFIFSMGRVWDEGKNLAALATVAAQVNWPVYIAGDPVHPVTRQLNVLDNVHYLGTLTPAATREYLSRAAIFVLPAKYEPFGLSPLEAALSGCALVLSKLASLQEIWGDAGVYINPTDEASLTTTLNELTQNEIKRKQIGARALRHGLQYSAKQMAATYLQTYTTLLPILKSNSAGQPVLLSRTI